MPGLRSGGEMCLFAQNLIVIFFWYFCFFDMLRRNYTPMKPDGTWTRSLINEWPGLNMYWYPKYVFYFSFLEWYTCKHCNVYFSFDLYWEPLVTMPTFGMPYIESSAKWPTNTQDHISVSSDTELEWFRSLFIWTKNAHTLEWVGGWV